MAAQFSSLVGLAAGGQEEELYGYFDYRQGEQPAVGAAFPVGFGMSQQEVGMVNLGKRDGVCVEEEGEGSVPKRQRSPTSSRDNNSRGGNVGGQQVNMSQATLAARAAGKGGGRRLWVKERDRQWWDMVSSPDYPEVEFKKAFRMSRATFEMPLRQVSKRFGLGISTCHKLVLEVSAAIKALLMPKVVLWPEGEVAAAVNASFEAVSGISGIVGAVYTTHIPIIAPKESVTLYYNRIHTERNQKTSYTVTVQGVVDSTGTFTDVCIGWPGSHSDAYVLERLLWRNDQDRQAW
ncbi:hypothetical protein ABZP36_027312 [Zizania latifolia]